MENRIVFIAIGVGSPQKIYIYGSKGAAEIHHHPEASPHIERWQGGYWEYEPTNIETL